MGLGDFVLLPEQIVVPVALCDELRELDVLVQAINDQRPFGEAEVEAIEKELHHDAVYHSAAIEGMTLSHRETVQVLTTGAILDGRRRESQEVLNLARASELVHHLIEQEEDLSPAVIRELHAILLKDIVSPEEGGQYRAGDVTIAGATMEPPPGGDVPALIQEFSDRYKEALALVLHPLVLASWVHHAIARIHPFTDGNGRVARCVQDFVLLKNRYVPATIRQHDRSEYYEALEQADGGDYEPLVTLNLLRTQAIADRYIAGIRRRKARVDWASKIAAAAQERQLELRRTEYRQWRRWMELVRFEIELAAGELERLSSRPLVQVQFHDLLEFEGWSTLTQTGRVARAWYFRTHFLREPPPNLIYAFWFGRHWWTEEDPPPIRQQQLASLLVSERRPVPGPGEEKWDYRLLNESEQLVSLRELLVVDDRLVRRRYDPSAGRHEYDWDADPMQVATEFLGEVLRNRLGVL